MTCRPGFLFFSFCTFLLLVSPAQAERDNDQASDEPLSYLTEPVREISGPMRTVTVGGFQSMGAFTEKYGDWDIGSGLSAMLTSALVDSGRFIVVERAALSDILSEQELTAAGLSNGSNAAAQTGQLMGVQLLIYGAVTEFDNRLKSGGFSIGVSKSLWKGGAGRKKTEGIVAFDFRVVNTSTGEIIESHSVSKTITAKGFDISVGYKDVSMGDRNFSKTPLGQASREAITQAVHLIAESAANTNWTGSVVEIEGREIYLNAGHTSGVQAGDEFIVEHIDRVMTDPETGEVLLVRKTELGTLRVMDVLEKLSVGVFEPTGNQSPQRGDLVILPAD